MKNFFLPLSKITGIAMLLLFSEVSFGQTQKKMSCIDSLIKNNPEYSNNKHFMQEVTTKRAKGVSDKQIFDEYNTEEAKKNKAYMDAANEKFIKEYILPLNNNAKKNKNLSPNSYYCHADSLGLLSATSMGNWKGFTQSLNNTAACNGPTPWTATALPCNSCVGNTSGFINNISIAPPPASEPCADIPGFPINLPSPYGGTQSIQLGNNQINAQSDRCAYSFVVQPTDISFNYQYAAVLNDPAHVPANQPFFDFVILGPLGDTVPCSYQHYVAAPNTPGWQTSNQSNASCNPNALGSFVYYKPWTVVGVNLSNYVGKQVTVVATVGDCSQCGHFGIVYLDFACTALNTGQFCLGDTSSMLVAPYDPSFSYQWSTGATTDTIIVNPNNYLPPNDTIKVHVSQGSSLCPFDFAYVLAPTHIYPGFVDSIACNKVWFTDTTKITSGTLSSWSWSYTGGNPTSSTSQNPGPIVYPPGGTYTVSLQVASAANCKDSVKNVVITIPPLPQVAPNNASVCGSHTDTICANATTGSPAYTYLWSPGGSTTSCIVVNSASSSSYNVVVTDSKGCTASGTGNVTVAPGPTILTGPTQTICTAGCTTITASGAGPNGTYVWSPVSGLSNPNSASPVACPNSTTTYSVVGTDASGCSNTASQTVNVVSPPTVSAAAPTVCPGKTTNLCASGAGGAPPYTYYWPSTGQTTNCITVVVTSPTSYSVNITDAIGCTNGGSGSVNSYPPVFISAIASQTICNTDSTQLFSNASNGTTPYSWGWLPSTSITGPNQQNPWAHPNVSTNYTVTVTDADGCTADTTVYVGVVTIPNGSFDWTDKLTCDGIDIYFRDNLSNNTVSGMWHFGDGATDTSIHHPPTNPLIHHYAWGTYTVVLTTINSPCHTDTSMTLVISDSLAAYGFCGPTVFTPNGDNKNDCFHPVFMDPACNCAAPCTNTNGPSQATMDLLETCFTLEVYDRWGIKMFESNSTKNCWDGTTMHGTPAKEGTYYYIAKFGDKVTKGYVELLR